MFLVVGITGKVGGATATRLLAQGKKVRALVRDRAKAASWTDQGVELVDGDWNNAAAIERALKGVDGAFVMLPAVTRPRRISRKPRASSYVEALSAAPPRVPDPSSILPAGNRPSARRTTSVPRWRRCWGGRRGRGIASLNLVRWSARMKSQRNWAMSCSSTSKPLPSRGPVGQQRSSSSASRRARPDRPKPCLRPSTRAGWTSASLARSTSPAQRFPAMSSLRLRRPLRRKSADRR